MDKHIREAFAAEFRAKNANRKDGRTRDSHSERRQALVLRRLSGGKFGNMSGAEWNLRIAGTTGHRRAGKDAG